MCTSSNTATGPGTEQTYQALRVVADALDQPVCWLFKGAYHFVVGDGRTVAVCPESAGRFRLSACAWTRPASTVWVFAEDHARLASLVLELADEVTLSSV